MAKINGVEVRALKSFTGREGECLQGTVYLNGKKLGFWSQDSWGGPDQFDFDVRLLDDACKKYEAGFPDTYTLKDICGDPEILINEVAILKDIETSCMRMLRGGAKAVVYMTDGYHCSWFSVNKDYTDEEILTRSAKTIAQLAKGMFVNEERVKVFREGDFDLIVDAEHPVPEFFLNKRYM